MIKKKICMIGAFAVGKTSLVQRYVNSIFSEKYMTTIGVKIDQKMIQVDGKEVNLLLWDIHGEDEFQKVKSAYLTGASGYFLVIDGTRKNTLDVARNLQEMATNATQDAPWIALINKADLKGEWEIQENELRQLKEKGWELLETSAKDDMNVEEAFRRIAQLMLNT